MKAKIIRKDGTVIELEGTAEELARFIEEPRIEIKGAPAPAVDFGKLLEEVMKQDKQVPPIWPERAPHCPGIAQRWPNVRLLPFMTMDPCSIGNHDFPGSWLGMNPPACTRCGVQAAPHQLIYTNEGIGSLVVSCAQDSTARLPFLRVH